MFVQELQVPFRYAVSFTRDMFAPDNGALRDVFTFREAHRKHRFVVVVDSGVLAAWPQLPRAVVQYAEAHTEMMTLAAEVIAFPGGEAGKTRVDLVDDLLARF